MCRDIDPARASYNGLSLAYIGDAVYELMVRTYVLSRGEKTSEGLHTDSIGFTNATFQAAAVRAILPLLTPEETSVYRRGRNSRPSHTPRNKGSYEYHEATGFEAVFGWLSLGGEKERLEELFDAVTAYALSGGD